MADLHDDLLRTAQSGDAEAQYALGNAYRLGTGVARQLPVAMRWYLKAATQGHRDAQVNLGLMFLQELAQTGMQRNPGQARYWFRRAAEAGDAQAMFYLARAILDHGTSGERQEAIDWLERAGEAGHAQAFTELGLLLLAGQAGVRDPAGGLHWLTRAAEQGMPEAQYELARHLRGVPGIEPDPLLVLHYLHEAADQDHVPAMFALALRLEHGEGLDRAYPEQAAHWYRRLARDHGHGAAAHNLGILHVEGRGVERSVRTACDMFQLAIALGCNEAMYSLALLHCAGGTPSDFEAAATWSMLSQEYCPERGGSVLLTGLAGRLNPQQMEAARSAAQAWKSRIAPASDAQDRRQEAREALLAEPA